VAASAYDQAMLRRSRGVLWLAGLALTLAGCARSANQPVPVACVGTPQDVTGALVGAPGRVVLTDGTSLSRCVARATSDGDLQNVGTVFSGAADSLAARMAHDPGAALRLGFLIGAVRRGALHTQGVSAELVRRLEQSGRMDAPPPSVEAALRRGLSAGQDHG